MMSCIKSLLRPEKRSILLYISASVLLLLSASLALALGSTPLSLSEILRALLGTDKTSVASRVFLYVRLPRVLGSLVCGGALALSGAVIQGVLSNRLASPSVIGVNAGAALAVTLCAAFGLAGGILLSLFSFLGAFAAVLLVSLGAKKWGASRGTVILMGVAMNALLGAITDAVTVFYPDIAVWGIDFKVGDFSSVTYARLLPAAAVILLVSGILMMLQNELSVLSLGEDNARGLGLNAALMRPLLLLLAAALAGAAVSVCGLLSFVGLLVPHAVRRMMGSSRHLLLLSLLFGAGFVCLSDTLARVVLMPYEIPVGIIMSVIGAPFFIWILVRTKGGRTDA